MEQAPTMPNEMLPADILRQHSRPVDKSGVVEAVKKRRLQGRPTVGNEAGRKVKRVGVAMQIDAKSRQARDSTLVPLLKHVEREPTGGSKYQSTFLGYCAAECHDKRHHRTLNLQIFLFPTTRSRQHQLSNFSTSQYLSSSSYPTLTDSHRGAENCLHSSDRRVSCSRWRTTGT